MTETISIPEDLPSCVACDAGASPGSLRLRHLPADDDQPYPVHVMTAGASFMANEQAKYVRAISLLGACTATDCWPDNSTDGVLEVLPWQAFEASGVPAGARLVEEDAAEECTQ